MTKESRPGGIGKEVYRSQFEWLARVVGGFDESQKKGFKKGNISLYLWNNIAAKGLRRKRAIIVDFESKDLTEFVILNSEEIISYNVFLRKSRAGVTSTPKAVYHFPSGSYPSGVDSEEAREIRKQLRQNLIGKVRQFLANKPVEIDPDTF